MLIKTFTEGMENTSNTLNKELYYVKEILVY